MKDLAVPQYLLETYWWAYVYPRAVRFFDRPWLINLILWGNYVRLRDAALHALGERLTPGGSLDVVDVVRAQLDNLARKLNGGPRVGLLHGDSSALDLADATYDRVLLFFLPHEQPGEVRRRTISEALRVLKPGGRLVILDYHRPHPWHPLYWPMVAVLRTLEPFAMDLWRDDIEDWLPGGAGIVTHAKHFGELYQLLAIEKD